MPNAKDIKFSNGTTCSADQLRQIQFDTLKSNLEEELSHKSSELEFEDSRLIKETFLFFEWCAEHELEQGMKLYEEGFFNPVRKIKWLGV